MHVVAREIMLWISILDGPGLGMSWFGVPMLKPDCFHRHSESRQLFGRVLKQDPNILAGNMKMVLIIFVTRSTSENSVFYFLLTYYCENEW